MKKNKDKVKNSKHSEKDNCAKDNLNSSSIQTKGGFRGKEVDHKSNVSQVRRNDPQWYVPNEQIAKDTANIPFNLFNGIKYPVLDNNKVNTGVDPHSLANPGINLFNYIPWYGNSGNGQGLELATQSLFATVRAANAGRVNYEAPDLMMYILCMDQIYLRIHELLRIMRLINTYAYKNRELPRALIEMMGFDFNELNTNQANYRARLNTLIYKANGLAVPAKFDIFKRRAILGSVVLTDDPERPTQLIVPRADGYFYLNETFKTGTTLNYKGYFEIDIGSDQYQNTDGYTVTGKPKLNFDTLCDEINTELDNLLLSSDINIMAGDIMKAFGDDLHSLGNITALDTIEFTHDKELLTQFSNSIVLDNPYATAMVYESYASDRRRARMPLSSLCFVAPKVTDTDANLALQQRPIISQVNGRILTGAYIIGEFTSGTVNMGNVTVGAPKSMTNARKLTAFTTIPMRIFDDNKDPATNLERSRLMMLTTLGNSAINHYYFEDKDGITNDIKEILTSTCSELLTGTEIGLGWITSFITLGEYTTPGLRGIQYFQFAKVSSFVTGPESQSSWLQITTTDENLNWGSIYTYQDNQSCNISSAALAVEGMFYGPLTYPCDVVYDETDTWKIKNFWFYSLVVYSTGNNTALVNTDMLKQMHDTALLGLLTPKVKVLNR